MNTSTGAWKKDRRRNDAIIIHFLIFVLGVFTGYLWAAAAYGIIS